MPLTNLNDEQKLSATCKLGYNLTIASAGTGKTSTIVGRIGHLLNSNIKPQEILLLTFTNKASAEMIKRVANIFNDEIASNIMAGTFHSISYKLIKSLNIDIVLKQPNDLKTLFKSLYEKRIFMITDIQPYDGGYLYDIYSLYQNSNNGELFRDWILKRNESHASYIDIYEDIIDEFDILKRKFSYANFDDLLLRMIKIQKKHKFNFKEILVDEYQDTNPLQNRLLDGFKPKSLFCVGDYDQSIYGFNGSDIGIISSFHFRYKNSNIFTLKKNYRSTKPILDLASRVIGFNERIYEKKLEVVRDVVPHIPQLLAFDELYNQYEYIAKNILKSNTKNENIAVIYRNNSSADGIEANLKDLSIACKRKGGYSFFDAKEVRVLLDLLTLLVNNNDMMAFIHLIEYGKGIGKAIAKDIFDALVKLGSGSIISGLTNPNKDIKNPYKKNIIKNEQLGLFDDFIEIGSIGKFKHLNLSDKFLENAILKHPKLSPEGASFLYQFYLIIKDLQKVNSPLSALIHIQKSDFFATITEYLCKTRAKQKDGTINMDIKKNSYYKIIKRVEILKQLSRKYNNMKKFLNAMILGGSELSEGEGVNLLSIHASKGLEFSEVYICDLMNGRFPNKMLISRGGSLEEERRLFYVAVTRAKDILYLSYAKYDKIKRIDFVYSQFLVEAGLLQKNKK